MKNTNCEENEVLKRMLNTPHMPHKLAKESSPKDKKRPNDASSRPA